MSLQNIITQLNAVLSTMTGIERWYDDPPESLNQFPCGLSYASNGEMSVASFGASKALHTITFEVHHARTISQEAIDAAKVWPDRVLAKLAANPSLNGACDTVVWPVRWQAMPLPYGTDELHYGVRFSMTVKAMGTW